MTVTLTILGVLLGGAIIVGFWLMSIYNGLIKLRNQVDEGWSDIDVQLKRRHDLIPNLVETVKGYAKHEKELLERIVKDRSAAMSATTPQEMAKAENALMGGIKSLFVAVENYPDLKANDSFMKLQDNLTDTEDKIQASRRFYNGVVRDFNTKLQVFPNNLVANMLGFKAREFFEVENAQERENIAVKF